MLQLKAISIAYLNQALEYHHNCHETYLPSQLDISLVY